MNSIFTRQEKVCAELRLRRLDCLLVTSLPNIFYLTGFRGSAGAAAVTATGTTLWVDPRYTIQARAQASAHRVLETRKGLVRTAAAWCRKKRFRRVGIDESSLSCRTYGELQQRAGKKVRLIHAGGLVERLRVVKDAGEADLVRQACRLTSEVLEEVLPQVRQGVSELDIAAELEYRMKRKGAEGPAFDTIVASGPRTALPHATPSSKLLEKGDLVIIDLGAILHGYASDLTRTVYLGKPPGRVRKLYRAVQEAQERGIGSVRPGVTAGSVDRAVRTSLKRRGLDRYFTHSTGHGVGIEIHELPRLGGRDKSRIEAGAVVTVEPGIYLEGFGGIRIEDTVLADSEGAEILTPVSKDDWILG